MQKIWITNPSYYIKKSPRSVPFWNKKQQSRTYAPPSPSFLEEEIFRTGSILSAPFVKFLDLDETVIHRTVSSLIGCPLARDSPFSLPAFPSPRLFPSLGLFLLGRGAHRATRQHTGTAYVQGIGVILRNVRVESLVIIRFFNRATMQIHAYTRVYTSERGEGERHTAICIIDSVSVNNRVYTRFRTRCDSIDLYDRSIDRSRFYEKVDWLWIISRFIRMRGV